MLVLLPFTAIVVYGYSELIFSSMRTAENRTVQQYLRIEYALFEQRYVETGSEQLPSSRNLAAWWAGDPDLPASFAALEAGLHLVDGEEHVLVAVPLRIRQPDVEKGQGSSHELGAFSARRDVLTGFI